MPIQIPGVEEIIRAVVVPKIKPLIGVQYLRAVGALMVMVYHLLEQIPTYSPYFERALQRLLLRNGVDLFFVISGFIMVVANRRTSPLEFLWRRIIRIVPLYWLLTLLVAVIVLWQPELFRTTTLGGMYLLKSLFFIPYANPGQQGLYFPLLVPGWSLNFEMFFYLLFAVVLIAPLYRRPLWMAAAFVALLLAAHLQGAGARPELQFFANMRLFEFLSGMLIAQRYLRGGLGVPALLARLLIVTGFVLLLIGQPWVPASPDSWMRFLVDSLLPSSMLVLGIVALESRHGIRRIALIAFLGDASYSMYLSHIFSLGVARLIWDKLGLIHDSWPSALGFALFGIFSACIGAAVVFRVLERPMLDWFQSLRGKPQAAGSESAPAAVAASARVPPPAGSAK